MSCVHRWLVYRTVRGSRWTVRYRRCGSCGTCSKTIQRGFIDARNWLERPLSLPDGPSIQGDAAIMERGDIHHSSERKS